MNKLFKAILQGVQVVQYILNICMLSILMKKLGSQNVSVCPELPINLGN